MNKAMEKKILVYVEALEIINQQLVIRLQKCLEMLEHIKPAAPDQEPWQGMLDDMKRIIRSGEKLQPQKSLH